MASVNITSQHTPAALLKALVEDIREMLDGKLFRNPDKNSDEKFIQIKVFEQNLPVPQLSEESVSGGIDYVEDADPDPVNNAPWCLVKIDKGNIKGPNADQEVSVVVCFGIYDDENSNNGHRQIMSLIMKTYQRYAEKPILKKNYRCSSDFEWAPNEDDTWPYFFGAISMTFRIEGMKVEDKYA